MTVDGNANAELKRRTLREENREANVKPMTKWRQEVERPARWQQWIVLLIPVVILYALPVLNPPIISTEPAFNFPLACFRHGLLRVDRDRLEHRRATPVSSTSVVRRRCLHRRHADLARLAFDPHSLPVDAAGRHCGRDGLGVTLGISTLRLRGDYLAIASPPGFGEIIRALATIIPAMKGNVGFQALAHHPVSTQKVTRSSSSPMARPSYWLNPDHHHS